jgi:hypothetical protein
MKSLFVAAILAATTIAAHAQPPGPRAPSAWKFDASGWTLLGTQAVDGKKDRDTITVGRYEGKFDELILVVGDSDLQLEDFTVIFGNGEKFSPKLKHGFKEGQRSRTIDLPGNDRTIARIEVLYKNTPGGGRATLSIYGRDKRAKPPANNAFDSRGWTLLGGQTVDGRRDKDTLVVGKYQGRFDQLTMIVSDSDLDLQDFTVVFGNGERWSPKLRHGFKEGQRSKTIDLPGDDRTIAKIELAYRNTPGGGKARVEVFGKDTGKRPSGPPRPLPYAFDATGWTLLGSRAVDGRRDRDQIRVGRFPGKFDQITLVVSDSDLELKDLNVVFSNGQRWSPKTAHTFREGARARAIDLPGKDRTIARIELSYANLPGGGKAKVEVYGRDLKRPEPPPITPIVWESKGWTMIGKATVDGWRDRDTLTVRSAVPFSELMFVAAGSDVEVHNIVVTFGNNEKLELPTKVVFREGTRTTPLDLPGKLRKIKTVQFTYANLPGGGRAALQVWARAKPATQPAPPPLPPPGNPPGPRPPGNPKMTPSPITPTPPVVRDHR